MIENFSNNDHIRQRTKSLFDSRPRINTELTFELLEKLVSLNISTLPQHGSVSSTVSSENIQQTKKRRRFFYIAEPLVAGLLIFPLTAWFWQSGWNFTIEWLDSPSGQHPAALPSLYGFAQLVLLLIYLNQDRFYDFLQRHEKNFWFVTIFLQFHSFLTGIIYIIQWVSLWTIFDVYTTDDWLLLIILSVAATLALIVLTGNPCDAVCVPFVTSYDSIEFNIRIGTSLIITKIGDNCAKFLNFLLYENIISILSTIAWRGLYQLLDVHLFPDSLDLSAGISLIIGYLSFFVLMYTQSFEMKPSVFTTFMQQNYPSLISNIQHLLEFLSCVILWRGFWMFFDNHLATLTFTYDHPYVFYTIGIFASFLILTLMKTASSINGPMSQLPDDYSLFPNYPHSYLSEWFKNHRNKKKTSSKDPIAPVFTVAVL